jgi:hypothetical protein
MRTSILKKETLIKRIVRILHERFSSFLRVEVNQKKLSNDKKTGSSEDYDILEKS